MSVLLILLLAAFVAALVAIFAYAVTWSPAETASAEPKTASLSLGLPSLSCTINQALPAGNTLVIVTGGPKDVPACRRVMVIDLASGRVRRELRL